MSDDNTFDPQMPWEGPLRAERAPAAAISSLGPVPGSTVFSLRPPQEIIEAADKVAAWMEKNGYRNWQLGAVCDRRLARKTILTAEELEREVRRWERLERKAVIRRDYAAAAEYAQAADKYAAQLNDRDQSNTRAD